MLCAVLYYNTEFVCCPALAWGLVASNSHFTPLPFAKRAWSAARPPTPDSEKGISLPAALTTGSRSLCTIHSATTGAQRLNTRCPRRPTKRTKRRRSTTRHDERLLLRLCHLSSSRLRLDRRYNSKETVERQRETVGAPASLRRRQPGAGTDIRRAG